MLKLIARAVIPLIAMVTVAQADTTAGRITYINTASHEVLVDNVAVRLAASADLSGLNVGQSVHVAYPNDGAGARIAAYAPIIEQKATGRITFMGDDRVVINNASIEIPSGMDLSAFSLSNSAEVTFTSVAGLNFAVALTPPASQLASAEGRITYVDPIARMILVDSATWIKVPGKADIGQYQIGSYLTASYSSNNGINVAMTLASL